MQSQPEETRETSFHVTHGKGRTRGVRGVVVVVGKDKTDGTKKKKNTKGGQGEKVLGSKPARTQGWDSSRSRFEYPYRMCFSISRFSLFLPVASPHQVPQDLYITCGAIVRARVQPASSRTHTHVRAAQHSLSSNTPSHHTIIPRFLSCSTVLV